MPPGSGRLISGLFDPDRAFATGARSHRILLLLVIYGLTVAGARLGAGMMLTPLSRVLAVNEVDTRLGSVMSGAPPEAQARARNQMLDSLLGGSSGFMLAFSQAASGILLLLLLVEMWLLSLVVTQFFGGQEDRRGLDRRSLDLYLVAFLPLALRRLVAGIVATLRTTESAQNALTLEDYRRVSEVRFDLPGLAGWNGLPPIVETYLRMLTDPFLLWTLVILVLGGRQVFRVTHRGAVAQVLVLVGFLGLQNWLLGRAGLGWGM